MNEPIDNALPDNGKSLRLGAALLVLLTLVVYFPVIGGGFVWDDDTLIVHNRLIHADDGLHRFWLTTEAPDYYPLTWTAWWLEWRLWGGNAAQYHVVNVLLHAANAILVLLLLRRLAVPGAWLAAFVFALHPVNVATAGWISEQKNTLSMFFGLAAILLYLKFDENGRWRWYGFSVASFLLALLAKSAVVMLPVVLLGCLGWRHGRVRLKEFLLAGPFFALSLAAGSATIWFQNHRVLKGGNVMVGGFLSRLAIAGHAPWFYLYKAVVPFYLSAVYPRWDVDPPGWISFLPGIVLIGGFVFFWRKRRTWGRPFLFGLGSFVVLLFPVLGFFDQDFYQYSFVADPWQYYSIVGVIGLAVGGATALVRRLDKERQFWGRIAAVAVLAVLGMATWTRAGVYASEEALWQDTVRVNPQAWMPHYNLGSSLLSAGRFNEALVQFGLAMRIRPDLAKIHSNMGIALAQAGRMDDAVVQLGQAAQIDPDLAEVQANLGHALMAVGRPAEAMEHWEQALRIKPDFAEVHYDLGLTLEQMGKLEEAIQQFELAVKFQPGLVDAQNELVRLQTHPQGLRERHAR